MIAVTKLLELYTTPYNKEYYSSKHALLRVLENRSGKKAVFTMNSYLKNISLDDGLEYIEMYVRKLNFTDEFLKEKYDVLEKWRLNFLKKTKEGIEGHNREYGEVIYTKSEPQIFTTSFDNGIYIEQNVCSKKYGVVGRIDKLITKDNSCIIEDLKTSTTVNKVVQDKFKYPLDNLFQTQLNKRRLQLGLYGFIMEEMGYKVDKLLVKHTEGFGGIITEIKYLKGEIKLLLEHYKSKQ